MTQEHLSERGEDITQLIRARLVSNTDETVWIRIRSRRAKFTMGIFESAALGIVVSVRSTPRIRVERRPIASTVPRLSPYPAARSPTAMGLSANRLRPPIRFSDRRLCRKGEGQPADAESGDDSIERDPKSIGAHGQ